MRESSPHVSCGLGTFSQTISMKEHMNTILIIGLIVGVALLAVFHRPKQESAAELRQWFSKQLTTISENLEEDIAEEKLGHYPHAGKQSFESKGRITYTLLDKNLSRYELSQFQELRAEDVASTAGYQLLQDTVDRLGLSMKLEEVMVDGDGVETWHELDEYVYDFPRFYTVTVSGW